MNPRYSIVAERAGHRCEYCGAPEVLFNFPFEVEHIVPVIRGGSDQDTNLALACRACNVHKGPAVDGLDLETNSVVRLFNPREDRWGDHFRTDSTGAIAGMTAIGRATIFRLRMNAPAQMEARTQWIRLKQFPPF